MAIGSPEFRVPRPAQGTGIHCRTNVRLWWKRRWKSQTGWYTAYYLARGPNLDEPANAWDEFRAALPGVRTLRDLLAVDPVALSDALMHALDGPPSEDDLRRLMPLEMTVEGAESQPVPLLSSEQTLQEFFPHLALATVFRNFHFTGPLPRNLWGFIEFASAWATRTAETLGVSLDDIPDQWGPFDVPDAREITTSLWALGALNLGDLASRVRAVATAIRWLNRLGEVLPAHDGYEVLFNNFRDTERYYNLWELAEWAEFWHMPEQSSLLRRVAAHEYLQQPPVDPSDGLFLGWQFLFDWGDAAAARKIAALIPVPALPEPEAKLPLEPGEDFRSDVRESFELLLLRASAAKEDGDFPAALDAAEADLALIDKLYGLNALMRTGGAYGDVIQLALLVGELRGLLRAQRESPPAVALENALAPLLESQRRMERAWLESRGKLVGDVADLYGEVGALRGDIDAQSKLLLELPRLTSDLIQRVWLAEEKFAAERDRVLQELRALAGTEVAARPEAEAKALVGSTAWDLLLTESRNDLIAAQFLYENRPSEGSALIAIGWARAVEREVHAALQRAGSNGGTSLGSLAEAVRQSPTRLCDLEPGLRELGTLRNRAAHGGLFRDQDLSKVRELVFAIGAPEGGLITKAATFQSQR